MERLDPPSGNDARGSSPSFADEAVRRPRRLYWKRSPIAGRKKATTIALDPEDDRLLSRAARERGVSRSEFIRQHLAPVLEQYRRHPKPRSAGIVRALTERGDERELFGGGR